MFRGLWGEPQSDTVVDSDCIYSHTDEFYYPFKDETNDQINNVVKTKSKSLITIFGETAEFKNYKLGKYNEDKDIYKKDLLKAHLI